jgi:hypothetical protein
MPAGSSLPYTLRPNKAVDRELFLSLLARLSPTLELERYHYIGLGGPFLEDFRLIHSRLGIARMTSVESEEQTHRRQVFNRPIGSIECVHRTLEEYLDATYLDEPVIIWFDYTDPGAVSTQIERFARTVGEVPLRSVLRITLNANPSSLGKPDAEELSVEVDDEATQDRTDKPTIQEWRLERLRERLGPLFPAGLGPDEMTHKTYGPSILITLKLAVEKELLSHSDRQGIWAFATHYADGQPMVTATLAVCAADDDTVKTLIRGWEFYSTIEAPHQLDLPALSALERLTMESSEDPRGKLGFDLPVSDMGIEPFVVFERYYRLYPHFSRVHL